MSTSLEACTSSTLPSSSARVTAYCDDDAGQVDTSGNDGPGSSEGSPLEDDSASERCRVCGDAQAKMHYGVLACFGCKGFFRRALKRATQYECSNNRKCVIDKFERNSCRYCRLQRCLEVGMDPSAVRPDRDFTGPQHAIRLPVLRKPQKEEAVDSLNGENSEWSKRLPVEMRTMLMNLLNIEARVTKGDTRKKAHEVYPLPAHTLRELIDDPSKLKGLRTEMRYEPYRMAENSELLLIAYRRLIAAVDWVTYLCEMLDGISLDDKIALVKSCFASLLVFTFAVRTAEVTDDPDILCMCNFCFVPRDMAKAYTDSYHLSNGLVDRALNELVSPLRTLKLRQEEIVCLSATIVLNSLAKDLSPGGSQKVIELRSRIQDTLFHVIKETRSKEHTSIQFGNLLLFLPNVTLIANSMCENLQFAQTFSHLGGIPLLTNLFGCFPVEPFADPPHFECSEKEFAMEVDDAEGDDCERRVGRQIKMFKEVAVQTEPVKKGAVRKRRRVEPTLLSPIENSEERGFKLLQPPCAYTLTEMFDDVNTDTRDQFVAQIKDKNALLNSCSESMTRTSQRNILSPALRFRNEQFAVPNLPRQPRHYSYSGLPQNFQQAFQENPRLSPYKESCAAKSLDDLNGDAFQLACEEDSFSAYFQSYKAVTITAQTSSEGSSESPSSRSFPAPIAELRNGLVAAPFSDDLLDSFLCSTPQYFLHNTTVPSCDEKAVPTRLFATNSAVSTSHVAGAASDGPSHAAVTAHLAAHFPSINSCQHIPQTTPDIPHSCIALKGTNMQSVFEA